MSDAIKKPAHYNQGPIECIDAMKIVLTPEEFRGYLKGNVFKYLWREKDKNGIEDLRKGREYYDRLIEHCDILESLLDISNGLVKAWTCENGKAKQVYPEQPQPPDGWRWLEVGEVMRKGDTDRSCEPIPKDWIGSACRHKHNVLRRNKFEVGEKVVRVSNGVVYKVVRILSMGYQLESEFCAEVILHGKDLAPYIEETT